MRAIGLLGFSPSANPARYTPSISKKPIGRRCNRQAGAVQHVQEVALSDVARHDDPREGEQVLLRSAQSVAHAAGRREAGFPGKLACRPAGITIGVREGTDTVAKAIFHHALAPNDLL